MSSGIDYDEIERKDGVRFSWNVWPSSKAESAKLVMPLGATYTPLFVRQDIPVIHGGEPVVCKAPCRAFMNPYCQVDFGAKFWICQFCLQRNPLPPHMRMATPENAPVELHATTIEYVLPGRQMPHPPVFVLVVDIAVEMQDLPGLKASLMQTMMGLPRDALVGIVTFGTVVQLHELGFGANSGSTIPKSYVFRGNKEYPVQKIHDMLGIVSIANATGGNPAAIAAGQLGRFFVQRQGAGETQLLALIEGLQRDSWPIEADKRARRSTGAALALTLALLEGVIVPGGGLARVMAFLGGPCTEGAGQVVPLELSQEIRTHRNITMESAAHYKKALAFYDGLAMRAANSGFPIDLFVGCLDQVGLAEMRNCSGWTGGHLVLAESFVHPTFGKSIDWILSSSSGPDKSRRLDMTFNGILEVQATRELKISGLIGPAIGLARKSSSVNDVPAERVGLSGTTAWKLGSITPATTVALYFDVAGPVAPSAPNTAPPCGMLQFATHYQRGTGEFCVRISTVCRMFATNEPNNPAAGIGRIVSGFDQATTTLLVARQAVFKAEQEQNVPEVLRTMDRNLIRVCQKFGDYHKDDPNSFRLNSLFSMYPQFMFHLRRSPFLQVFNSSPDESAYFRSVLNRECVRNTVIMIMPTLFEYRYGSAAPNPVLLDSASIKPDCVYLMDSFFVVFIGRGMHVAEWVANKCDEKPEYAALKELLQAPIRDSQLIISGATSPSGLARFPIPREITCDQNKSAWRHLLAKLNPSTSSGSQNPSNAVQGGLVGGNPYGGQQMQQQAQPSQTYGQEVYTDDVSFQMFLEHLKKLAASSNQQAALDGK